MSGQKYEITSFNPHGNRATNTGSCVLVTMHAEQPGRQNLVQRIQIDHGRIYGALARERSEESLRESEARLNLAATSADAGLWNLEIASGHIWATEEA